MPSFDVVSDFDAHEARNAVDQANREVNTRFDFKGTGSKYALDEQAKGIAEAGVEHFTAIREGTVHEVIRDYAKEHGVGDAEAVKQGMDEKSAEFKEKGAEVYVKG